MVVSRNECHKTQATYVVVDEELLGTASGRRLLSSWVECSRVDTSQDGGGGEDGFKHDVRQ